MQADEAWSQYWEAVKAGAVVRTGGDELLCSSRGGGLRGLALGCRPYL
jgi:hypothetical protein